MPHRPVPADVSLRRVEWLETTALHGDRIADVPTPQARHREADLVILPSAQAIGMLTETATDTNAPSGHLH